MLIASENYNNWAEFWIVVEKHYGMTREQLHTAFYNLSKGEDETAWDFVLRIESRRVALEVEELVTYHCFRGRLPLTIRKEL